jgi:hypothetical protein
MIKYGKLISWRQLREDKTWDAEFKEDKLKTVLVTPDDNWAVFLGGDKELKVYVAALPNGLKNMCELKIDKAGDYTFDKETHKACITLKKSGEMCLLISRCLRKGGRSVRFPLGVHFA